MKTNDFNQINYKSLRLPSSPVAEKLSLTESDFQEDLTLLRYALLNAYGARGTIDEDLFLSVDSELKKLSFIDKPKNLCEKIGEILSQFPDYHLQAKFNGESCYKRKIVKINIGKNRNDSKQPWKGIVEVNGIYTISISKFPPGAWPGFHEFIDEAMKNSKAIVIDLRGNGGGDDSIAFEMAERLARQKLETPFASDLKRNSPETLTIWDNSLKLMKKHFSDPEMHKQIDMYINDNSKLLAKSLAGEIQEYTSEPVESTYWKYDTSKGYKRPIYILQDKECGSSAESAIDFFEYFPNITKVGINTAGMIHFGNVGLVILPNSGITIQMPTKANKYKDGRFIEFTGITPDIVLNDGQDAYDYVLALLNN
jgi:hypothetical protein